MTAVGFVRGEQFVELVSRDLATGDLNFYLLSFEQRCSYDSGGCDLASLLTDEIERDWTAYSVYDQDDLEPTSFDCQSCHQPGGAGHEAHPAHAGARQPVDALVPAAFRPADGFRSRPRSRSSPRRTGTTGNTAASRSTVITSALDEGSGAQLEALVRAEGFGDQPNPFDAQIAAEMKSGTSPTWQARFQTHLGGDAIAVPYPRIDVTDEAKRSRCRSARTRTWSAAPRRDETLLDLRDVFSDDAAEKLSFVPQPGADGKAVLLQMCARCHDGRGNPQLNKSRFNVRRLDEMTRAEKDLAISRISESGLTRMPPWRVGQLHPGRRSARPPPSCRSNALGLRAGPPGRQVSRAGQLRQRHDPDRDRQRILDTLDQVPPARRQVQPVARDEPRREHRRALLLDGCEVELIAQDRVAGDRVGAKVVVLHARASAR